MGENSIKIGRLTIQYGITPVHKLLEAGYTLSDFEQIVEEPTLATCNLKKGTEFIAILSFYNLKETIEPEELAEVPIDLVLLHEAKPRKKPRKAALTERQALRSRIVWTCCVHLIAATIFLCVYAVPLLFAWVQTTEVRMPGGGAGVPMGIVLLVLPAFLILFLWTEDTPKGKKGILNKILLSLLLIVNVAISATYLVLIDNVFTHRFF